MGLIDPRVIRLLFLLSLLLFPIEIDERMRRLHSQNDIRMAEQLVEFFAIQL